MVTSKYEWNIFKWDKQQQQINKQTNKKKWYAAVILELYISQSKDENKWIGGLACEGELKND